MLEPVSRLEEERRRKKTVHFKVGFYYDRNSTEPSWTMDLSGSLDDSTDVMIFNFTRKTGKAVFKQKVL
jgi:hypothetical protein